MTEETLSTLALLLLAGVDSITTAASLLAELPNPTLLVLDFLDSLEVDAEREGVAAGCSSGTEEVESGLSRER